MYTDVSSIHKMFANNPLGGFRNPQYPPGYAQYFGQGHGSDGKMPCALTFTGKFFKKNFIINFCAKRF